MEEPDPVTIRAAAAGDEAALDALIRAYQVPVWRFLRHLVRDDALAEDITQETFVRVYRRLDTFHFESKFSTWVFQIARNAGIDALRSRDRRTALHRAAPEPSPVEDPVTTAELHAALDSLTPLLREAIVAIEVLGLTYREAGEIVDAPEGTVKRRVHDARLALARWAADATDDADGTPDGVTGTDFGEGRP